MHGFCLSLELILLWTTKYTSWETNSVLTNKKHFVCLVPCLPPRPLNSRNVRVHWTLGDDREIMNRERERAASCSIRPRVVAIRDGSMPSRPRRCARQPVADTHRGPQQRTSSVSFSAVYAKKKLTLVGRDKKVAYCPIRIHSGDPFAEIVEVGGGHGSPVAKDARSSCPAGVRAPVSHQSL
jgi:hypothetical protein